VDGDQLLEQLACQRVGGAGGIRRCRTRGARDNREQQRPGEEAGAGTGSHWVSFAGSTTSSRNVPGRIGGRGCGCSAVAGGGGPKLAVTRNRRCACSSSALVRAPRRVASGRTTARAPLPSVPTAVSTPSPPPPPNPPRPPQPHFPPSTP